MILDRGGNPPLPVESGRLILALGRNTRQRVYSVSKLAPSPLAGFGRNLVKAHRKSPRLCYPCFFPHSTYHLPLLTPQSHAAREVLEARVGAHRIERGVSFGFGEFTEFLPRSCFQPHKHVVLFPQAHA